MMTDTVAANAAFRRLLVRSVFVPILVMAVLGAVMFAQVTQLRLAASEVEHSDNVIAKLYRAETKIVEGQSSVRGFMITGDEEHLQMFNDAAKTLPGYLAELRALTIDRGQATGFCDAIEANRRIWNDYVNGRIELRRQTGSIPPYTVKSIGTDAMASMRQSFTTWIKQETDLRNERNAATKRWAHLTRAVALIVPLVVGAFLAVVARGQLRWLSQSYEGAFARLRELSESLERRVVDRTRELETANSKLNEANHELEAFAYSVSHDLRAPMRHISGFANLLKSSSHASLGAEDLEHLETIHQTAVVAGRMVDDLLAFSRVGRSELRKGTVDTNAVIAATVRELTPEVGQRQIQWNIADLPPLQGDPGLIKLVIQNLLSNAVKYTSTRDVAQIEVGSRSEADGMTYWVKDNGVGFDMAYAHKLFGVFQRLHHAEEFEGTGIGLANVRRIIMRHGGRAWAEGMPNAGAAFFFFLPSASSREAIDTAGNGAHR
jgi:signal transduction histidine kinase